MLVIWLAAISIALPSVFFDFRDRRIPNILILYGLVISVSAVCYEQGLVGLPDALLGGLLVFLVSFVFWMIGWLGAGDVKLIGVFGILAGLSRSGELLINVALAGAVLALIFLVVKGGVKSSWQRLNYMFASREHQLVEATGDDAKVVRLPYAIAVVAGAFATMMGLSPIA